MVPPTAPRPRWRSYESDPTWRAVQPFLPEANRLVPGRMPEESYLRVCGADVHVDRHVAARPWARVVAFHGVGGNGRLLSFLAVPLSGRGIEVVCPDLPLYGLTECGGEVGYGLWVRVGSELVGALAADGMPTFTLGLSAGGLLAYQVACARPEVRGVMATCLLDQRLPEVTRSTARNRLMGALSKPLLSLARGPLGRVRVPMRATCKMSAIVNDPALAALLMADPLSAGASVPVGFLRTMLRPEVTMEPTCFRRPVLLAHPAEDRWTDVALSRSFFDRLAGPRELVMLGGASHFPIEQPGLSQLEDACVSFVGRHAGCDARARA